MIRFVVTTLVVLLVLVTWSWLHEIRREGKS